MNGFRIFWDAFIMMQQGVVIEFIGQTKWLEAQK